LKGVGQVKIHNRLANRISHNALQHLAVLSVFEWGKGE